MIPALYAECIPHVRIDVAPLLTELDDVGCVLQCSGFRCIKNIFYFKSNYSKPLLITNSMRSSCMLIPGNFQNFCFYQEDSSTRCTVVDSDELRFGCGRMGDTCTLCRVHSRCQNGRSPSSYGVRQRRTCCSIVDSDLGFVPLVS